MKIYLDIEPQVEVHPDEDGNPHQELTDEIVRYIFADGKYGILFEFSRAGRPLDWDEVDIQFDFEPDAEVQFKDVEIPPHDMIKVIYEKK